MSTDDSTANPATKQCSYCLKWFPATHEFFYRKSGRCKPCLKIVAKEWAQDHPEQRKASINKWDANHREENKTKAHNWRGKNITKRRKQLNTWRGKNRERFNTTSSERRRNDYAKDPAPYKAAVEKRRAARYHAAINDFTPVQWERVKKHFHYLCAYCGAKPKRLTKDHVVPLIKGGNHTISNIVPACHSCNSKKKDGPVLCPIQPLLL